MPLPPKNSPVLSTADDPEDVAANSDEGVIAVEARLHPILTNEEVLAARVKARKRLDDERRKSALKEVEEIELAALKIAEGMMTGTEMDEDVTVTVDLPEFSPSLNINGRPYWHGFTYTVPRHVAMSLNEMMFRANRHQELEIEGRKLGEYYRRPHLTAIGKSGVQNMPGGH